MVLPFQHFVFSSASSPKELQRKFMLLLEQRADLSGSRRRMGKKPRERSPLFSGTFEGDHFELVSRKSNGDEDMVRISATLQPSGNNLKIDLRLLFTGSWMTNLAGGVIIALVAAFMYQYIGEKVFHHILSTPAMPYLLLTVCAVYLNLRSYSTRAVAMVEQIIYWLELEET